MSRAQAVTEIIWEPLQEPGFEHLRLTELEGGIRADGLVVTKRGKAWRRYRYGLLLDARWRTREARILDLDDPRLALHVHGDGNGAWRTPEGIPLDIAPATDVDIAFTPFTNTLPIRRNRLEVGEGVTLDALYLAGPDLAPAVLAQRYTRLGADSEGSYAGEERYLYESLESGFRAELVVDERGLVVEYPGLYRQVGGE